MRPTKARAIRTASPTEADRLRAHGLPVERVEGDTIHWKSPPTEAAMAFAQELLGRPVTHA